MRLRAHQQANRIDDVETALKFSEALCLIDYGAYTDALKVIQDVQSAAHGSAIVGPTMSMLHNKAEDEVRSAFEAERQPTDRWAIGAKSESCAGAPAPACGVWLA